MGSFCLGTDLLDLILILIIILAVIGLLIV